MKSESFRTMLARKSGEGSRPVLLEGVYRNPQNGEVIRVVGVRGTLVTYNRAVSSEDCGAASVTTVLVGFLREFPLDDFEELGVMGDNEWLCYACPGVGLMRNASGHPKVTEIEFTIDPEAAPSSVLRSEIDGLKRRLRILQAA